MRVQADGTFDGGLSRDARRLHVDAASTSALRASLSGPLARVRSRRVTIDVASWQAPRPRWSGRLGPLPGVLRHEIRLPEQSGESGSGRARVRVVLIEPLPFHLIAAAALEALTPASRLPVPVSPDVVAYGHQPPWLPPSANLAGLVGDSPDQEVIQPYDVLLTDAVAPGPGVPGLAALEVLAQPWGVAGKVVVDATVTNPRGYRASSQVGALLETSPAGLAVRAGVGGSEPGSLSDVLGLLAPDRIEAVRALRSIRVGALDGTDAAAEALVLVQLAMTGVVVHTPAALPGAVAGRLAVELIAILAEPLPGASESATASASDAATGWATEWEARSVRQRRAALRNHATAWALPTLAVLPAEVRTPSVSLVLAVTRPDQVRAALAMFAAQTYPSLELVLGLPDSVRSAVEPADKRRRQAGRPVELVCTDHGAEPAERARGSFITRIEPDALYGIDHVWDLVLAMHYSGAAVVGKACEFFLHGQAAAVRRPAAAPESFTDTMSDGPLLLARADMAAAGGWRNLAAGPGYLTHPFGFVRPEPPDQGMAHQGMATSKSATDRRTYPLTVVAS